MYLRLGLNLCTLGECGGNAGTASSISFLLRLRPALWHISLFAILSYDSENAAAVPGLHLPGLHPYTALQLRDALHPSKVMGWHT
jgi:hypothetical protein